MSETIRRIEPGQRMSRAVVHGSTVYLQGLTPTERAGDIRAQTRSVLQRIDEALAAAGSDKTRLLTVTIYLANIGDWAAMNEVWDAWIVPPELPARTTVEARLAATDLKIEVTATAAL